jgi:hypothetical protein
VTGILWGPPDHADVGTFEEDESPAQPPGSSRLRALPAAWSSLSDLDRNLGAILLTYNGPLGMVPSMRELAAQLAPLTRRGTCSPRWVRARLALLVELGYLTREARYDDDRPAGKGKGRQTSNRYTVRPDPPYFRGPPGSSSRPIAPPGSRGNAQLAPPEVGVTAGAVLVPPLNSEGEERLEQGELVAPGEPRPGWQELRDGLDQKLGRVPPERADDDLRAAWRVLARHLGPLALVELVPNREMTRREGERRRQQYRRGAAGRAG